MWTKRERLNTLRTTTINRLICLKLKIRPDISFSTTTVWLLVADEHLINRAKFLFIISSDVMRELLLNVWQRPLPDRVSRSD